MTLNFPNTPVVGQTYAPLGAPVYKWDGSVWVAIPPSSGGGGGISDAPVDNINYVRKNAAWNTLPVDDWTVITGKPATFPPTLPIAQTGVTNLVSDLAARELTANKGVANGYASLDGSTKVPAAQLPSYVDDVVEYANLAAFPGTGTAGLIYVALDTNKIYRWGGSSYTEISPSPGSTDAVPEGATNKYYTDARVAASPAVATLTTADTARVLKAGDTMTGPLILPASTAANAGLNIGFGTPPTTPVSGDVWINGDIVSYQGQTGTRVLVNTANAQTISGAKTFTTLATFTGSVLVNGNISIQASIPQFYMDKTASGQASFFVFRTGPSGSTLTRWQIVSNATAESAGAGSDFEIRRFNDAGTQIDIPFAMARVSGVTTLLGGTAPPAGGSNATAALKLSSTTNFGVFFGSGAPTLSAAQGSIYLRSDGTGTNTRVYVNTNGTTGWSAMSVIATGTSAPASPAVNDVWIDTT